MSNGQHPGGPPPTPMLVEHSPRVFVLRPLHYEKDCEIYKTWLDGLSFRGGRLVQTTTNIREDGTVTILVLGIEEKPRRVAVPR